MLTNATFDNIVGASVTVRDNMARAVARATSGKQMATASAGTIVHDGKTYAGEYDVIPQPRKQVFETKDCLMREDFTVDEIKLHEAPNQHGTTITIGG